MRSAALAVLAALLVAGAGCTSHGSSGGPTSGVSGSSAPLAPFAGNGYSVGVPSSWSGCSIPAGGAEVPATDQFRPSSEAFAPILDVSDEVKTRTYAHAISFHELVLEVTPHFKEISKGSVDVSGATQAQRIEYTQESPYPTANGDFPKVHGISLVAEAKDGSIYSLVISAAQPDWNKLAPTLVAMADSFRLGTGSPSRVLPTCSGVATPAPSGLSSP